MEAELRQLGEPLLPVLPFAGEGTGDVAVPDALLLHRVQLLCLADDSQDDLKLLGAQSLHLPLLLSLECVH